MPPQKQQYYVKWIRFYLDFCHKYNFQQGTNTSQSAFMDKLREKRRSEKQRKQVHHAVTLYLELVFRSAKNTGNKEPQKQKGSREQLTRTKKVLFNQENKQLENISAVANKPEHFGNEVLKLSGTDWTAVYSGLKNAIKIRHYSPSTLKTYKSWTRKFQTYTRSKDIPDSALQKALRTAVKKAKIPKRVTSHTFRHSFEGLTLFAICQPPATGKL